MPAVPWRNRAICASSSGRAARPSNYRLKPLPLSFPPALRQKRLRHRFGERSRMYVYDEFDRTFITERAAQFRDQVARRLSGKLTEDEFKPLRLMNGVYLQLHAYMLRIAIPYCTLSPAQVRMLAFIARKYDRNYGHFTTRQNLQFHWPALKDIPDILEHLAS